MYNVKKRDNEVNEQKVRAEARFDWFSVDFLAW